MSDAVDFGDAPANVCPVLLGGERVDLVITSPGRVLRFIQALSTEDAEEAEERLAAVLAATWPEPDVLPDDPRKAFEWLWPRYTLRDIRVAVDRLTVRVAGLYPSPEEVADCVRHFPVSSGLDE